MQIPETTMVAFFHPMGNSTARLTHLTTWSVHTLPLG
jgi:hypothetical protein